LRASSRPARPANRGITTNTVAQATPMLLGYVASFVSAPIVLHAIGLRAFGIWALTGALAQYAALLDFGVGPTLARFVALHDAREEHDQIGEVLGTGAITATVVSLGLIIGAVVAAAPLAKTLGGITTADMRLLLLCATVIFSSTMFANVLTAFNVGMQEMVIPNVALSIGVGLNFAFSVAAALTSSSLVRYADANAVASLLSLLVVFVCMRMTTRDRVRVTMPSRDTLRQVLGYSVKNQALTASSLINFQTDKIVIALFIGPAVAGAYELANRVAAAARSVGVLVVGAMVPTMTSDAVRKSAHELAETYLRWTGRTAVLGIPALIFVAAMPQAILHSWLGPVPVHAVVVLAVLAAGYVINATTGVGYTLAYAMGHPGIPAKAALYTAAGNLVATIALAPLLGLWGVLIGTAAAFTCGALYQVWLVHARYVIPLRGYGSAISGPIALALALVTIPILTQLLVAGDGRIAEGVAVLAAGAVYVSAYAYAALRLDFLPEAIRRLVPGHHRAPESPAT
jgi:O-antigen/teichoic acid export membrane protein